MDSFVSPNWQALGLDPPSSPADWDEGRLRAVFEDAYSTYTTADHELLLPQTSDRRYGSVLARETPRSCPVEKRVLDDGRCIIRVMLRLHRSADFQASVPVTLHVQADGSLHPQEPMRIEVPASRDPYTYQQLIHRLLTRLECAGAAQVALEVHLGWLHDGSLPAPADPVLRQIELTQLKSTLFRGPTALTDDGSPPGDLAAYLLDAWRRFESGSQAQDIGLLRSAIEQMDLPKSEFVRNRLLRVLQEQRLAVQSTPNDLIHQLDQQLLQDPYAPQSAIERPARAEWALEDELIAGWTLEKLRRIFQDEWTDSACRQWKVCVRSPGSGASISWHHHYGGSARATVHGMIYCDGQYAGSFMRSLDLREGGKLGTVIRHEELYMEDDYCGQGFGREWLRRCVARYAALEADEVTLTTATSGAVVWPRMGFVPTYDYDSCTNIDEHIENLLSDWQRSCNVEPSAGPDFGAYAAQIEGLREDGSGEEWIELFEQIYADACAWQRASQAHKHPFSEAAVPMGAEIERLREYLEIDSIALAQARRQLSAEMPTISMSELDTLPIPAMSAQLPEITAQPALDA